MTEWELSNQELIDNYKEDCVTRLAEKTIYNFVSRVKVFNEFTKKDLLKIDYKDLNKFLKHLQGKELSPETIRGYYYGLGSFYEFLEFEEIITRNYIPSFRKRYLKHILRNRECEP